MPPSRKQAHTGGLSNEYVNDSTDEGSDDDTNNAIGNSFQSSIVKSSKLLNGDRHSKPSTTSGSTQASDDGSSTETGSSEAEESHVSGSDNASGSSPPGSSSHTKKRKADRPPTKDDSKNKKSKIFPSETTEIHPQPFIVPTGYETIKRSASDYTSDTDNMFTNLANKEIWHFSAPEDLSIQSITMLDVREALSGAPVLQKNDIDYVMQNRPARKQRLLVNHGNGDAYKESIIQVTRSFQLQESTKTQSSNTQNTSEFLQMSGDEMSRFSAAIPGKTKPPRKQPGGLKMRFVPYGSYPQPLSLREGVKKVFQVSDNIEESGVTEASKAKKSKTREKSDFHKGKKVDGTQASVEEGQKKVTFSSSEPQTKPVETKPVERKKKKKARLVDEAVA